MKLAKTIIFFFVLITNHSFADNRDTLYIKDLSDFFIIKWQTTLRTTGLDIINTKYNKKLSLRPNDSRSVGIGVTYKFINIGIGYKSKSMSGDNEVYGKTSRFDVQINSYARKYLLNFYLQWYKGLYVSNPKEIKKDWDTTFYPQIPDAAILNLGSTFYWMLNYKKFSFRSSYYYNEIQKKNASTFLVGGGVNTSLGNAKNYFFPDIWINLVNNDTIAILKNYKTLAMFVSGGYSFTKVTKKQKTFFNFSLILSLGPYFSYSSLLIGGKSKPIINSGINFSTDTRLAIGTNLGKKNKVFLGVYVVGFTNSYKLNSIYSIKTVIKKARFFIGYRFL